MVDATFAKDCVTHQLRSGEPAHAVPRGPQASKEHLASWQPLEKVPDLKEGYATRAVISMLRGWWIWLDAKLARAERTGSYLLWLASSSGLMKLN